jgi:catechol 2,3-dioxygenase-like lactoylglutathione lyase family enzyme
VISHISFGVRDLGRAIAFYDAVAKPLGAERLWTKADGAGYGYPGTEDALALKLRSEASAPGPGFHCAFDAGNRAAVDAFFEAAIGAGGADNGAPGLRPHYSESYYAAFVIDPDGHRIEALCTTGM